MRSKAPLAMMEQMVMILVFALASALCLQAFVQSDQQSRRMEARDRAVTLCQSVAETMRHNGGSAAEAAQVTAEKLGYRFDKGVLYQEFDENWNPVEYGVYRLEAEGIPTDVSTPDFQAAHVCAAQGYNYGQELDILFEIEVAWQGGERP